jgi:serine/threonine protein kinase
MGQVFLGIDPDGREFACKTLRPELTTDPAAVGRFLQERSILVRLRHPNLVGVHDLVAEGDTVGIVMDLVNGRDLRQVLTESGPLLPAEVARIGAGIASALSVVHQAGVVHRDIKPENVLMDDVDVPPTPRLTDFGISRIASGADLGRSTLLAGTPQYVAPELVDGADPTPAADLYSLGIVLYELCCGVTPFAGGSMLAVLRKHAEMEPGRPDGIPDALWDVLAWLLAKGPGGRPQTAAKVATILDALAIELRGVPVAPRLDTPPPATPATDDLRTQTSLTPPSAGRASPPGGASPPGPGTALAPARRRGRGKLVATGTVVLLLLIGGVAYASGRGGGSPHAAGGSPSSAPDTGPAATDLAGPGDSTEPASSTPSTTPTPTAADPTGPAPNLVGKALADVPGLLPPSVRLVTTESLDSKAVDNTVLSQSPAAGKPLTDTMKVTVARQPIVTYLAEQDVATGEWSTADFTAGLSGKQYPHSLGRELSGCDSYSPTIEYNLSRGYRRLVTTAGLGDNGRDSSLQVRLELFVDDRPVYAGTIHFGKATPISIDVTGGLRLKVQFESIKLSCDGYDELTLGQPELLGVPGEVPQSTDTPTADSTDTPTDVPTDDPSDTPTP